MLQLFKSNQPVPLPSFDDNIYFGSESSSSLGSLSSVSSINHRKVTCQSDIQVNVLEKVEEEDLKDPDIQNGSLRSKSSKGSLHSSIQELSKQGIGAFKKWRSLGKVASKRGE